MADPEQEDNWWDDPGIPWNHKPTKSDIWCLSLIGVVGVYALILLPLRPVMLTWAPQILAMIGSRTGVVMTGALAAVGDPWWFPVWIVASISNIKFDWIYWWAGALWGHSIIEIWSGKSERARKRNDRAVKLTKKYAVLAMALTYLPLPIPGPVVFAALGAAQMKLWRFLALNLTWSAIATAAYMYLGFAIGEPAVELVKTYSTWLTWLSVAILVGMIFVWWRNDHKKQAEDNTQKDPSPSGD